MMLNKYLFILSSKYILINTFLILILIIFINILEISRIIEARDNELNQLALLSLLKLPSIVSEIIPFVIIISIAFLFKNLISNNELISMRNVGFSILDIFKPIGLSILLFGFVILVFLNPLSAKFEKKFNEITNKNKSDIYSIKVIENGMWIKNVANNNQLNYINISEINLNTMYANNIKIFQVSEDSNKVIISKKGKIDNKKFVLYNVTIENLDNNTKQKKGKIILDLNFEKENIINSISNYKHIPYYKYIEHINSLKKFNLYAPEIALFYLSEICKPFFLLIIGFVVMGFSGKFKRNENFFKILFVAVLIGFLIFLFKEIMITITSKFSINYIISYLIILIIPTIFGFYQTVKIEND